MWRPAIDAKPDRSDRLIAPVPVFATIMNRIGRFRCTHIAAACGRFTRSIAADSLSTVPTGWLAASRDRSTAGNWGRSGCTADRRGANGSSHAAGSRSSNTAWCGSSHAAGSWSGTAGWCSVAGVAAVPTVLHATHLATPSAATRAAGITGRDAAGIAVAPASLNAGVAHRHSHDRHNSRHHKHQTVHQCLRRSRFACVPTQFPGEHNAQLAKAPRMLK